MAKEQAPAFQFYPKDYTHDPNVRAMSYTQRGIYVELLLTLWTERRLPHVDAFLARMLGLRPTEFVRHWKAISPCFTVVNIDGVDYIEHPRLEKERQKQQAWRDKSTAGANKRWNKGGNGVALGSQSHPNALQSASSTPVEKESTPPAEKVEKEDLLGGSVLPKRGINPKPKLNPNIVNHGDPVELERWQFDDFVKKLEPRYKFGAAEKAMKWVRWVADDLREKGTVVSTTNTRDWWKARFAEDAQRIAPPIRRCRGGHNPPCRSDADCIDRVNQEAYQRALAEDAAIEAAAKQAS